MSGFREKLEHHLAELAKGGATSRSESSGRVAVLLSGGVDSSVVASAAVAVLGGRAQAITLRSEFLSNHDLFWVRAVVRHLGLPHRLETIRLLDDAEIQANENDRCYRCKLLVCGAARRMLPGVLLLDGAHAGDDPQRPGRRALQELGVRSPLAECGFAKSLVRALAAEYGLPNADRPANSCLATRLDRGRVIQREDLARVARLEEVLLEEGFRDVRARLSGQKVIIEISQESEKLLECSHHRIMETIKGLGLNLTGYTRRHA